MMILKWGFSLLILWMYNSKFYILGSALVTLLLNRVTNKLYYPPLIINMVSVILLFIVKSDKNYLYNVYICYLPVVITSILINLIIYIYRKY